MVKIQIRNALQLFVCFRPVMGAWLRFKGDTKNCSKERQFLRPQSGASMKNFMKQGLCTISPEADANQLAEVWKW